MDKRNQMENPFFDPDKPGSIFVGMDRYHQYSPHQPRNALTFIQKGDADSLFRKFLIDNIKEAAPIFRIRNCSGLTWRT